MKNFGQVLLGLFVCSAAIAQVPDRSKLPPIGIANVIEFALQAHPQAQIAADNVELAKQAVNSARADFKPGASASYNFSEIHNPVTSGLGDAQVGLAGVTVTQPLLNIGGFFNFQAAKERLEAAASNADAENLRVAIQATMTFVEVLKLRITLDLAAENYEYTKALIESMRSGELKDRASPSDLSVADTYWGSAVSAKSKVKSDARISENNFEKDTRLTAADYFLVLPEVLSCPRTRDEALQVASASNPKLLTAKTLAEAGKKDVKAAKMAYLPRVDAFASGYKMNRPVGDFKEVKMGGMSAGVNVTIPLFDSRRGPNIASQTIKQRIAARQVVDQSAIITNAIYNLYDQHQERHARLVGFCRSVKSGLEAVENMRGQLFSKYSVQELLNQKAALLNAGIQLNNEILAAVIDSFNVQLQMGTLLENLPAPVDPNSPQPNPHLMGLNAYYGLLKHCEDRKLFTLLPE
jgi:outer membrane protein TolC